jgi:hypothetical protein
MEHLAVMDAHPSAPTRERGDDVSDQITNPDQRSRLDELHARLVDAVESMIASDGWKHALEFAARFRSRSFNNTLLIWTQHAAAFEAGTVSEPTPTYVAGFKQWQALGRSVVAGQHGYMIFAPRNARFSTAAPLEPSSWRRLQPRERPRAGEVVRIGVIGTRPAYVWDIAQTTGEPVAELPRPELLRGVAPRGLWDGLATLVEKEGFTLTSVVDAREIGGANGRTDFSGRDVTVREDMDDAARAKTLAHELAHIRLHGADEEARRHRGIAEVEAESVALMVAAAHGMDTQAYTIPYVAGWASSVPDTNAVSVVQQTGERVRRAAVAILEQLPSEQIGTGTPPELDRARHGPELRPPVPTRHSSLTLKPDEVRSIR